MEQWDAAALVHLRAAGERVRDSGLSSLIERQVASAWRRNLDSYDPQLGDTPCSLGVSCHENIRELLARELADQRPSWFARNVVSTIIESSLRLTVAEFRILLMKAPPSASRTPDWAGSNFNWAGDSDLRHAAAQRNSEAYDPTASNLVGAQLSLSTHFDRNDATAMQDCLVVWSGDPQTGRTAGWLGFPQVSRPYWYAVTGLWWDEGTDGARIHEGDAPLPGSPRFDERPAPTPHLQLRRNVAAPVAGRG